MYPITLTKKLNNIEICGLKLGKLKAPKFKYPWEIIKWHQKNIDQILKIKIQREKSKFKNIDTGIYIGKNIKIAKQVVLNSSAGIIVIDKSAEIKPFSYIEGSCYIGKNTVIEPHTQIRKNTSIGYTCKIGGEVSGSIIQPYTNKAHYGFVGDSYIGTWVNLGAGTSISNLKNTYGPIRVEWQGSKINTKMQFFGCVIGDYSKAAINTSIYTGKIIGVCAHLFGCVSENIPSFTMDTHSGKKEFKLDAALRMQKRMMARRSIKPSKKDQDILKRVFKETRQERNF